MKTFTDNAGRTWTVALNVDALKRVRSLCDVDLMQVVADGGKLLDRLMADPVLLCDVVFAVCKEEAEAKGISDTDFGKGMAGDPIEHATQALLEELVGFFPNRTQRDVLGKVLGKMRRYAAMAGQLAMAKVDDPELDARMQKAIEDAFQPGGSSPSAPASSG